MTIQIRSVGDSQALRRRIASLPEVGAKIAKRVAEAFSDLAARAFDAQQSPDGTPWPPGKGGRVVTRNQTGKLRAAVVRYVAVGTRVRASVAGVPYGRYQHPDQFFPNPLPSAWSDVVRKIASEEITRHLSGQS